MAVLSIREIYQVALDAGFTPEQATTWTAIALAESGGRTGALNDRGEYSVGLWQINVNADGDRAGKWGDLNDPAGNARAAYAISRHGTDMRPWTTTHASNKGTDHDYRTHLDKVEAVTGVQGDDRGVEGYRSKLPPPLPSSGTQAATDDAAGYDQIGTGMQVGAQLDADNDGLTDAFERMAGTKTGMADSDRDGLSDGYEIAKSHTSPMLADSDRDGLSDSTEASLGTSGARWDSDSDGLSDQVEVRYGSDPLFAEAGDGQAPPSPTQPPTSATQMAAAPAGTAPAGTAPQATQDGTKVDRFVDSALSQSGDRYVFGARAKLSDADPEVFDCSELTRWAAHQAGVKIRDGAMYQYLDLKEANALMPVDEALKTKGALLFYFSREPVEGGGRPGKAHVAISLGDGRTIEAKGTRYGVGEFTARNRFNYAGMIPGLDASAPPPAPQTNMSAETVAPAAYDQIDAGAPVGVPPLDSDKDGLTDAFEKLAGMDPRSADTDKDGLGDAFEAIRSHTDPLAADTDKDGQSDPFEIAAGTDPGKIPGVAGVSGQGQFAEVVRGGVKDSDRDGLSDTYEKRAGLNPRAGDSDSDGLSDSTELSLGTKPIMFDSDADGLGDALELRFDSNPLAPGTPIGAGVGADPMSAPDGMGADDGLGADDAPN